MKEFRMKWIRALASNGAKGLVVAVGLLLLAAGCVTESQRISHVLDLRDRGEISDEQAVQMLRSPVATATQKPTVAGVQPQPQTTPQALIVEPVVASPAKAGYRPQAQIRGRLRSIGSDTLGPIMDAWMAGFEKHHPGFRLDGEHKGSSTAAPAIAEGQADFGPMSRTLKDQERDMLRSQLGYEPAFVRVALDTIAVYVHPSNPIAKRGLTLPELDAIFGGERKRGHAEITRWGQLGLTGNWANAPIRAFGRNSASGTNAYFREAILMKGPHGSSVTEMVGSEMVVTAVGNDPYAIGYSGIGYRTDAVAVIALAKDATSPFIAPEAQFAYSGEYPLARGLYLVVASKVGTPPKTAMKEFLSYVFSPEGSAVVAQQGFFPLSDAVIAEELAKLGM